MLWWHPPTPAGSTSAGPAHAARALGYIATLTQATACVWERSGQALRSGLRLLPGELRLRQGVARLHFDGGPDLVLEGPAHLRLTSSTAATVLAGKVYFRADETAAAFDLHTPSSVLVDLGTEYGVTVGPEGEAVHVFEGQVQRMAQNAVGAAASENIKAGQARRYGRAPESRGEAIALDREQFLRPLAEAALPGPEAAGGLLAYEGFDYPGRTALRDGTAGGGFGWAGPWTSILTRPLNAAGEGREVLNVAEGLSRPGAAVPAVGGSVDYTGFAKYFRRLRVPVRLDSDGVYYLSYLFRREGPPADPLNAVAILLWTDEDYRTQSEDRRQRLNIGVGGVNQLFTHLQGVGCRTPLPLTYGQTYLLVAKIVAGKDDPDQVFMRVYAPGEPVEREESGGWSVAGPPFQSDLVFDWLEVHVNSQTRQSLDEIRLGTTWASVTAPWLDRAAGKERLP
jgi:hypothetical protein